MVFSAIRVGFKPIMVLVKGNVNTQEYKRILRRMFEQIEAVDPGFLHASRQWWLQFSLKFVLL